MTRRMLIDAAHPEETRVAVVDGVRIEELDFEIASKRQLRGNIYLAKVVRVEPSLQAAFVEYGGNRHGFLAFNETHPDYFQIPHADREALLREVAEDPQDDDVDADLEHEVRAGGDDEDDAIEQELERRRRRLMRRYKIQEVVRRRQIMLIQVVKEERGNKGAALTTYLSLAGRYCVLMPNTARGGGISRKITNPADRKRLKSAANSLDVPTGMGLIIRTAGEARTKAEIKRDYDYLLRMWENIRETTLKSIAPALIYAEEDLVKRAVRDMFDKDFDSIQVEGEAGWNEAREFMRLIMPSQTGKVIHYTDATPLFVRHRIEDQLTQIHSPVVPLRSGGYLVINQTEALVAIDVNSGRATRERNIEQTALKTNMEAAEETARQLRLRDLAGLIVIDFIDMDEGKNNRAVEKVLKDCLKDDRARVQMGKISGFGLMEISRQRRRMGVLEGSTHVCERCQGAGRVRSVESSALEAMRAVELEAVKGGAGAVVLRLPVAVGLYVLNCKRPYLARVEETHGLVVTIAFDEALANAEQAIERTESRDGGRPLDLEPPRVDVAALARADGALDDDPAEEDEDDDVEDVLDPDAESEAVEPSVVVTHGRRRGRDRSSRGGASQPSADVVDASDVESDREEVDSAPSDGEQLGEAELRQRRRRRGRRGGRRFREETVEVDAYGWRHAHDASAQAPSDPYVWIDPHAARASDTFAREPAPAPAPEVKLLDATSPIASHPLSGPQVEAPVGADPYVWRDEEPGSEALVAPSSMAPTRSRRSRGGRGRGRGKPSNADAATFEQEASGQLSTSNVDTTAETEIVDDDSFASEEIVEFSAPAAVEPETESETATEAEAEAAPDPGAELPAAAEPAETPPAILSLVEPPPFSPPPEVEVREPDPAEISAPPAAPRRGWWRRGA